ncbi:MAG TPA: peptidoglycan editing factor PgeF [Balneolaceae bacterium]
MKNLKTEFSLIYPNSLDENDGIQACFSLKNELYNAQSPVPGLNLGFNTPEKKERIAQNRSALLSSLNIDKAWIAYADQVHSNRIKVVSQGGTYPSTDGLITRIPGLTLAIQVADCAAVLLWDSSAQIIAALHAGWRGVAGDIVPKGIEMMIEQGATPENLHAFVSPCLSFENFEVGEEVAEQFPDEQVDYENFAKPHLNLKGFIKQQLSENKIAGENIEVHPACTVGEVKNYYSYRREGNRSGRMMALIQIRG